MSSFYKIIEELQKSSVELIAVSKTRSTQEIMDLYDQGQRAFGENRVQELVEKRDSLPPDIKWHLIGSLQKNKVKYIAPFVNMIHSIDSYPLLQKVNQEAIKNNRIINVLIQIKIGQESSKHGMDSVRQYSELVQILEEKWDGVQISGLMGMASFVEDECQIKEEFNQLSNLFKKLKEDYKKDDKAFSHISMGMSGDYKIAIEAGSTMVRIGSLLFGPRA